MHYTVYAQQHLSKSEMVEEIIKSVKLKVHLAVSELCTDDLHLSLGNIISLNVLSRLHGHYVD